MKCKTTAASALASIVSFGAMQVDASHYMTAEKLHKRIAEGSCNLKNEQFASTWPTGTTASVRAKIALEEVNGKTAFQAAAVNSDIHCLWAMVAFTGTQYAHAAMLALRNAVHNDYTPPSTHPPVTIGDRPTETPTGAKQPTQPSVVKQPPPMPVKSPECAIESFKYSAMNDRCQQALGVKQSEKTLHHQSGRDIHSTGKASILLYPATGTITTYATAFCTTDNGTIKRRNGDCSLQADCRMTENTNVRAIGWVDAENHGVEIKVHDLIESGDLRLLRWSDYGDKMQHEGKDYSDRPFVCNFHSLDPFKIEWLTSMPAG